jgi:hypothetical protein
MNVALSFDLGGDEAREGIDPSRWGGWETLLADALLLARTLRPRPR